MDRDEMLLRKLEQIEHKQDQVAGTVIRLEERQLEMQKGFSERTEAIKNLAKRLTLLEKFRDKIVTIGTIIAGAWTAAVSFFVWIISHIPWTTPHK